MLLDTYITELKEWQMICIVFAMDHARTLIFCALSHIDFTPVLQGIPSSTKTIMLLSECQHGNLNKYGWFTQSNTQGTALW